jgi:nicotinamidase-related amidase
MLVDVQNTFCIPGFELYVGGHSGTAAVADNRRLCEFIYHNMKMVTDICPTMDTHHAMQNFHSIFLVNEKGGHPEPFALISEQDIEQGLWKFNAKLAPRLGVTEAYGQKYLRHYTRRLREGEKYSYTVWPYHAMLGGIGHALVSSVEEAVFFHGIARCSQPDFQVKGDNPFTENYSVLRPEVLDDAHGDPIAQKNTRFIEKLLDYDAVIIAGQAKSHCVVWTIDDLVNEILRTGRNVAEKVYLLEDCTSPIVIPGVADYTEEANAAFQRFSDSGMHIVRSTDPIDDWPGIILCRNGPSFP